MSVNDHTDIDRVGCDCRTRRSHCEYAIDTGGVIIGDCASRGYKARSKGVRSLCRTLKCDSLECIKTPCAINIISTNCTIINTSCEQCSTCLRTGKTRIQRQQLRRYTCRMRSRSRCAIERNKTRYRSGTAIEAGEIRLDASYTHVARTGNREVDDIRWSLRAECFDCVIIILCYINSTNSDTSRSGRMPECACGFIGVFHRAVTEHKQTHTRRGIRVTDRGCKPCNDNLVGLCHTRTVCKSHLLIRVLRTVLVRCTTCKYCSICRIDECYIKIICRCTILVIPVQ